MLHIYRDKPFRAKSLALIKLCNEIIADFRGQGFDLTLRQLYYQLVAKAVIENNERSYDNIGAMISDARLAGLIDWDAIVDRTRNLRGLPHWNSPAEIVAASAGQFNFDRWEDQPRRLEVWIEKDALAGVIEGVCSRYDVPFFSCRGYTSQSEMWGAAQRIVNHYAQGQEVTIIHLGDHDPSGIDMTRDIEERLAMFCDGHDTPAPEMRRIALNMNQVKKYNPPPNPAKISDCRAKKYIQTYGQDSWELDALNPKTISNLIEKEITSYIDDDKFEAATARQAAARKELRLISDNYSRVVKFLKRKKK